MEHVMEERIKEFAVQAIAKYWPNGSADHEKIFENFGKFMEIHAELIIQECIKVADDSQYSCRTFPVSTSLKQHFGIK
jgi:hypothetical protein